MAEFVHSSTGRASETQGDREPLVAVQGVAKRYGRKTVVEGVTLTVQTGEICGLVGANGSGKTTTLRMLGGILKPDGGRGRVLGLDLLHNPARIRELVGYMSQRSSLYADLSVFENLRFRAEVYGLRDTRAAVEAAIYGFGLLPWARSRARSLSEGWMRRVQLAAALLHSPRLVLLDEPTAGLDAVAHQEVWRHVERLASAGAGVIVSTHDLADAERCSHAAFFVDGRIVAVGTPAEVAAGAPAAVYLLSGRDVHRLAKELAAVAGVVTSYPQGESLRVIADPLVASDLSRLAVMRGVSFTSTRARLEDAVLARLLATGSPRT
jgi:ABC-type multidrug transport system ATPase subunit